MQEGLHGCVGTPGARGAAGCRAEAKEGGEFGEWKRGSLGGSALSKWAPGWTNQLSSEGG